MLYMCGLVYIVSHFNRHVATDMQGLQISRYLTVMNVSVVITECKMLQPML